MVGAPAAAFDCSELFKAQWLLDVIESVITKNSGDTHPHFKQLRLISFTPSLQLLLRQ
jgi:hypothetical protein